VSAVGSENGYREKADQLRLDLCVLADTGESMMEREGWPLDAVSAASLVARVIDDLDSRSEEKSNMLLSDLLCAAWPTCWSQDQ
jgi:hypothetical protein